MRPSLGHRLKIRDPLLDDGLLQMALRCRLFSGCAVPIDTTRRKHIIGQPRSQAIAIVGSFLGQEIGDLLLLVGDFCLVRLILVGHILCNQRGEIQL